MARFTQSFKYALRLMAKHPGFSLVVVATLALTVALSTTVFSVLEAVFLRPLPYNQPQRIVAVNTISPQGYWQPASYLEFLDWRREAHSFSALAAYNSNSGVNFQSDAASIALHAVSTSDNFFEVFQVKPALGRTFARGEEQPGRNFVVVLSYEVWRNQFGGQLGVLGKKVKLDGQSYTVIGVMPANFRFPINRTDAIYRPLHMTENQLKGRGNHWLFTVARLGEGITPSAAQAEMQSVLNQLGRVYPDTNGRRVKLQDLLSFTVGRTGSALHLLIYAVLALLAIGCVNIAGLLLARGVRLSREVAVRSVLGAGRGTLVSQFLIENAIYAVVGGILGAALAYGLVGATRALLMAALSRGTEVQINWIALVASLLLAMLTSLLAGLFPALRLSGTSINATLRTGSRAGADRGQHRLRAAFVITQVALALVLLMTAGLLFRAFSGLLHTNFGFEPDHILAAEIDLSPGSYETRDVLANFYLPLLARVKSISTVKEAGLIQLVPIQDYGWNSDVHIAGQPPSPPHEERLAEYRLVTPGYYAVFGQRLLRGRMLDMNRDTPTSQRVMVVNDRFVKRFVPEGKDPIGQIIDSDDKVQIVGVVSDIRQNIYEPPLAEMAMPISQIPAQMRLQVIPAINLVVKTTGKPEVVINDLRRTMHELDPTLPFRTPKSMKTIIAEALTFERLENWLFGTFAVLSVLLATLGLYGLISHEVELSTRDIGVRVALGATRARILAMVYRRVGEMLVIGLTVGGFVAWAAQKLIASVVASSFNQSAGTIAAVVFAFIVIALFAVVLPARRAVAIEPTEALRSE